MMINEMKNSRSSDLLPMFYDCKYFSIKNIFLKTIFPVGFGLGT